MNRIRDSKDEATCTVLYLDQCMSHEECSRQCLVTMLFKILPKKKEFCYLICPQDSFTLIALLFTIFYNIPSIHLEVIVIKFISDVMFLRIFFF